MTQRRLDGARRAAAAQALRTPAARTPAERWPGALGRSDHSAAVVTTLSLVGPTRRSEAATLPPHTLLPTAVSCLKGRLLAARPSAFRRLRVTTSHGQHSAAAVAPASLKGAGPTAA